MGVPIASFDDFSSKLVQRREEAAIFGVLLFDSRPSQKVVKSSTEAQTEWLDDFARACGIYFFYPLQKRGKKFKNPSPDIARIFSIPTAKLPGILMFAPPNPDGTIRADYAVYIQLADADFSKPSVYEPIFDDLSQVVGEAKVPASSTQEMLAHVRDGVRRLKARKLRRKLVVSLKDGAEVLLVKIQWL
ncbi:MAG: hypothetical protein JSS39_02070 [Nitrospira sp.]|nr:hypothetical protein [Nitrospira sp.]